MELVTEAMTREATKAVEAPPAPALAPTHCGGSHEDEDAQLAAALAMSVQQHGSAAMDEDPSPRNVIFLDVDGVLATTRSMLSDYEEGDATLIFDPRGQEFPLERSCVAQLLRLVEAAAAVVVLSSTWRLEPGMRRFLLEALAAGGIGEAVVVGSTPNLPGGGRLGGRGAEVRAWLADQHPLSVARFVLLDDGHAESFAAHELSGSFVQTAMDHGLTAAKADEAIGILTAGPLAGVPQPQQPQQPQAGEQGGASGAEPPAHRESAGDLGWACEACTFVNGDEGATACAVCGTAISEQRQAAGTAAGGGGGNRSGRPSDDPFIPVPLPHHPSQEDGGGAPAPLAATPPAARPPAVDPTPAPAGAAAAAAAAAAGAHTEVLAAVAEVEALTLLKQQRALGSTPKKKGKKKAGEKKRDLQARRRAAREEEAIVDKAKREAAREAAAAAAAHAVAEHAVLAALARDRTAHPDRAAHPYLPAPPEGDAASHEMMGLIAQVAKSGEDCGWLCYEEDGLTCDDVLYTCSCDHGFAYALADEAADLRSRMAAIAEDAPAEVQRYVVVLTARLAQVAKAFDGCYEHCDQDDIVKGQAALFQLACLHGADASGPARACAAAECARLGGVDMDAAWEAFPEAERRALAAIPWENDPEPAVVGSWRAEWLSDAVQTALNTGDGTLNYLAPHERPVGDRAQAGRDMLRPALRQFVPARDPALRGRCELRESPFHPLTLARERYKVRVDGVLQLPAELRPDSGSTAYVPFDFDLNQAATLDREGQAYVEEYLLPAARRVLPQLQAAVRRVAEAEGLDPDSAVRTPPLKTMKRMSEKAGVGEALRDAGEADHLLHEYPRQASNVDVARVMLILPSPAHVVRAVALFKAQCDVVRLKNRFARPSGGLRDILLNLCIDGVYCEVQVGIGTLVAVRRKMHKYYGVVRSIGTGPLVLMAKELTAKDVGLGCMTEVAAARQRQQPRLQWLEDFESKAKAEAETKAEIMAVLKS